MIKPQDFELADMDGVTRTYVLARLPAIEAREVVCNYPLSALPKLGDYPTNERMMLKLIGFCGVRVEGRDAPLMLTTKALVNNHVPDWETLFKLERAMLEYNVSFFKDGKTLSFSAVLKRVLPQIMQAIKTSTDSLAQSSQTGRRP